MLELFGGPDRDRSLSTSGMLRTPPSHGGSRRFESCCAHQQINNLADGINGTWCHLVPFKQFGTKLYASKNAT